MQYMVLPPANDGPADETDGVPTMMAVIQLTNQPLPTSSDSGRSATQSRPHAHIGAPVISMERILLNLCETQQTAFSRGRCNSYYRNLHNYVLFCDQYGFTPFPLNDKTLSLYAQSRVLKGYNPNSIVNMISTIKSVSKLMEYSLNEHKMTGVKLTLKAMQCLYGKPVKQALPITIDKLVDIGLSLNFDKKLHITMSALFLTSFFILLHKSNISTSSPADDSFLRQKHFSQKEKRYEITLEWSKMNQFHDTVEIMPLYEIPGSLLCPVNAIDEMMKEIPSEGDCPAFCTMGKKPIRYNTYQKFLKETEKIGYNSKEYSTHSFHRGGTTLLAQC